MIKKVFISLAIIGVVIISILAFILPSNPNEIIPAISLVSVDKPIWVCIMFGGSFLYLLILDEIYEKLEERK